MMLVYSALLTAVAVGGGGAPTALLRWAFYEPLRRATEEHIVHAAQAAEPLPRDGARRAVDQALRPPGGAALALAQPRRRRGEPRPAPRRSSRSASARANGLVFGAERIAVVWLGALLVLDSAFSVGMLFAFMAYKEQFSARVAGLIDKLIELRMLRLQAERLADIVLTRARGRVEPARAAATIDASLEVRDLSFRYSDTEPFVLRNCSFRDRAGRVGRDRRALGRRQDHAREADAGPARARPTARCSSAASTSQKLGIDRYRKLVGTVMQDDQLFAGSIADNMSFFDPGAGPGGDRALRAAGRRARRHRRDADGLQHADRRHGRGALRRPEAAHPARPRALQAAAHPLPRRGDERARRAEGARGERGDPVARASRASSSRTGPRRSPRPSA